MSSSARVLVTSKVKTWWDSKDDPLLCLPEDDMFLVEWNDEI